MEEIEGEQTEGRRGREGGREEGGGGASLRLGYRRDRPTCPSDGAAGAGGAPSCRTKRWRGVGAANRSL